MNPCFTYWTAAWVLFVTAATGSSARAASLGAGSYATEAPPGLKLPPAPFVTENIRGPVLTTDWCASLAFSATSHPMFAHPLAFQCQSNGLQVGYPNRRQVGKNHYAAPFPRDLLVRPSGLNATAVLMDAGSDWSVRARWAGAAFTATMGHGMPFCYFSTDSGIEVQTAGAPQVWHQEGATLGLSVGDRHYGLFAPAGAQWSTRGNAVSFDLAGQDYCSIAALPEAAAGTLKYFSRFAHNVITDTRVAWHYDEVRSQLTTAYTVTIHQNEGAETNVLFALYPHQWQHYQGAVTSYRYSSVRGEMKVIEAPSFVTVQPFTGLLPHLPLAAEDGRNGFDGSALKAQLTVEASKTPDALVRPKGDTYWTGKGLGRTAQLVRIADQVGDLKARDHFLAVLRSKLEGWFTWTPDERAEYFYYHRPWGTLIGVRPSYGSDQHLNDHHFHYGYYIYAAATVAQYDRAWANRWHAMVELLIRDCNSWDRADPLFPFLRAFDIYAGHSWASGDAAFGSGNNQESSSEAINFAAGTALWGLATGNRNLRDLGIFLFATEKNALLNYWFDTQRIVFPPNFPHTMVGLVWGDKADYATWFSGKPECIHGINLLPITAASLFLGHDPAYVRRNYAEILARKPSPQLDQWHDILWQFLALGDPAQAVRELQQHPDYRPEDGASRAHTYHWLHNLAALGRVRSDLTADAPSYAAFDLNGVTSYVAYNPGTTPRTVRFSDGQQLTVPSGALAVMKSAPAER